MFTGFEKLVFNATRRIPKGSVSTYSAIALAINKPAAARAVGNALNKNKDRNVPCHRVVRSDGGVGGFARGTKNKVKKLEGEGVEIKRGIIDLDRFGV
ncbi:MAG: MGMT family protein [Candidatus Micrarchaeia archaeon]